MEEDLTNDFPNSSRPHKKLLGVNGIDKIYKNMQIQCDIETRKNFFQFYFIFIFNLFLFI